MRRLWIWLVVLMVTGCAALPESDEARTMPAEPEGRAWSESLPDKPSSEADGGEEATPTAEAEATQSSGLGMAGSDETVTENSPDETWDGMQAASLMLLPLDIAAIMMERIGERLADGSLSESEANALMVTAEETLQDAEAALAEPAPLPEMEELWDETPEVAAMMRGVMEDWTTGAIDAQGVLDGIAFPRDEIEELWEAFETILAEDLGVENWTFTEIRDVTRAEAERRIDEVADAVIAEEGEGVAVSVYDLSVGDCFVTDMSGDAVGEVRLVDCDEPHIAEVYLLPQYPAGVSEPWVGDSEIDTFSEEECLGGFEEYVGTEYADSIFYVSYLQPSEESWADEDREVVCLIVGENDDDLLVGSAEGTGR